MSQSMKISVAMAVYKGEKYIAEQLSSILKQLSEDDEIIISDDFPQGETKKVIDEIFGGDTRIHYYQGPGQGVIKNFENAIKHCQGDIIFLSDQDDVWFDSKVKTVKDAFMENINVIVHDAKITDENLNVISESFMNDNNSSAGFIKNIIKNSYIGCCMAFKANMKKHILPFPKRLPMHDQWIGLVGEKTGKCLFLKKQLIFYRRHEDTVTGSASSFSQKLKWRFEIIKALHEKTI